MELISKFFGGQLSRYSKVRISMKTSERGMSAEESAGLDDDEVKRIAHLPDEE